MEYRLVQELFTAFRRLSKSTVYYNSNVWSMWGEISTRKLLKALILDYVRISQWHGSLQIRWLINSPDLCEREKHPQTFLSEIRTKLPDHQLQHTITTRISSVITSYSNRFVRSLTSLLRTLSWHIRLKALPKENTCSKTDITVFFYRKTSALMITEWRSQTSITRPILKRCKHYIRSFTRENPDIHFK